MSLVRRRTSALGLFGLILTACSGNSVELDAPGIGSTALAPSSTTSNESADPFASFNVVDVTRGPNAVDGPPMEEPYLAVRAWPSTDTEALQSVAETVADPDERVYVFTCPFTEAALNDFSTFVDSGDWRDEDSSARVAAPVSLNGDDHRGRYSSCLVRLHVVDATESEATALDREAVELGLAYLIYVDGPLPCNRGDADFYAPVDSKPDELHMGLSRCGIDPTS